mmetsp:Transcript_55959/g.89068  ORF Transcript_55959/g.89068 Transcript_55959/m.89068 type:complete len:227 (-) Transcript_55959:240-920(-)
MQDIQTSMRPPNSNHKYVHSRMFPQRQHNHPVMNCHRHRFSHSTRCNQTRNTDCGQFPYLRGQCLQDRQTCHRHRPSRSTMSLHRRNTIPLPRQRTHCQMDIRSNTRHRRCPRKALRWGMSSRLHSSRSSEMQPYCKSSGYNNCRSMSCSHRRQNNRHRRQKYPNTGYTRSRQLPYRYLLNNRRRCKNCSRLAIPANCRSRRRDRGKCRGQICTIPARFARSCRPR